MYVYFSGSSDIDKIISEHESVCMSSSGHLSGYYINLVEHRLRAWHKFVPLVDNMGPKNCWCINNYKVPSPIIQRSLSRWVNLDSIRKDYSSSEARSIVTSVQNEYMSFSPFGVQTCSSRHVAFSQNFFCLPQVYLIGFPKCGTTSLYSYLTSDASIAIPWVKEGQFWRGFAHVKDDSESDSYLQLAVLHYLYQYKGIAHKIAASSNARLIDASATNSYDFAEFGVDQKWDTCFIPTLLYRTLPNIKIIVIMREPVSRLWSHYWSFCSERWGRSQDDQILIPAEVTRAPAELFHRYSMSVMKKYLQCIKLNSEFKCLTFLRGKACEQPRLSVSLYYLHIAKWLSVFPRDRFYFLRTEDLMHDTYSEMKRLWKFLDTNILSEEDFNLTVKKNRIDNNVNDWIRSEGYRDIFQMWPRTRQLLQSFFRVYNERLARLLNDEKFLWQDV